MADQQQNKGSFPRAKFKDLGDGTFAEYIALEPGSITPPGGTASAVTISDATTPTQQAAVSALGRLQVELPAGGSGLTNTELRASPVPVSGTFWQAIQPVSGTVAVSNFPGTQPVSGTVAATKSGTWPLDTAAKGTTAAGNPTSEATDANTQSLHARITNASLAVTGTFWQATQPVSIAGTVNTDVIDRAARLLGHVTVDNASIAVTGTFWQATQPVSGTVTANIGTTNGLALDATLTGGSQKTKIVDTGGTNVATVKAASAIAAGTDTALVTTPTPQRGDASQWATAISGANAGVTLTIAAAGAGLFHYITSIEIVNINPTATAIAGSAVTLAYTSTNIPTGAAWTAGNALAAGAEKVVTRMNPGTPIKSTTANTATTIVAPAIGAGGLCRINVTYYIAP